MRVETSLVTPRTVENLQSSRFLYDIGSSTVIDEGSPDRPYTAASLANLYLTGATLLLVQSGQVDLTEPLKITPVNRLASWVNHKTGINLLPTYCVEDLLRRSIHDSDNMAMAAVADHIGRARLQKVVVGWELNSTIATARDVGMFLANLGKGEILDNVNSQKLIGWMRDQYLPNFGGGQTHLKYQDERIHEGGLSFRHKAGFAFGMRNTRWAFVSMTEDKPLEDEITTEQETVVQNYAANVAKRIA